MTEKSWELVPKKITPETGMTFVAESPAAQLVLFLSDEQDWVWDIPAAMSFTKQFAEGEVSISLLTDLLVLRKYGFVALKKDLQYVVEHLKNIHSSQRSALTALQTDVAEKLVLSSKENGNGNGNGKRHDLLKEHKEWLEIECAKAREICTGKTSAAETLLFNGQCPVCPIFLAEQWFTHKFTDHENYKEMFKEQFLTHLKESWQLREQVLSFSTEKILAIWGLTESEIRKAAEDHEESLMVDKLLLRV